MDTTSGATPGPLTVGSVAERYGVTVRTLHHYDAIGLVVPSGRTGAGYRLYTAEDVARLQHVVVYRRLGFGLDAIADLLTGEVDVAAHLQRQRASVTRRLRALEELLVALDHAWEREMQHRPATEVEIREIFGSRTEVFDEEYAADAESRWGGTEAWAEGRARSAELTREQWARVKTDQDELEADLARAVTAGLAPTSEEAMALAERHRLGVETFYECPPAFHRNLADMYRDDDRFRTHHEALATGLTDWLHAAVHANADRADRQSPS